VTGYLGKHSRGKGPGRRLLLPAVLCIVFTLSAAAVCDAFQAEFEGKRIRRIDVTFQGNDRDVTAFEQFHAVVSEAMGETYSAVRIRSALQALFDTDRIVSATVEAESAEDEVIVDFIIKRKSRVNRLNVQLVGAVGSGITEAELRLRLDLLSPGSTVSDRILDENASVILTFLRDRGFFEAEVSYESEALRNDTDVSVTFEVSPGKQAVVGELDVDISNFDTSGVRSDLSLGPGKYFSQQALSDDLEAVRAALREEGYLAPTVDVTRRVYESDTNTINISITGESGPKVNVEVASGRIELSQSRKTELLPVMREGSLDYSAIVEGERRLENYFQEQGYFFARAVPLCSVEPALDRSEASFTDNGTEELCTALTGAPLADRTVGIVYDVDLRLRLKLVDIRLEGTDRISIEDVRPVLQSQEASIIGIIPWLGYGRGYTSLDLLERDRIAIVAIMRELGFRNAEVGVKQGVSPDAKDLIITFVVSEGIPTKISEVAIEGNLDFSDAELADALPPLEGENYSRGKAKNGERKISQFYADRGYFNAKINYSIVETGIAPDGEFEEVKLVYRIENEGDPVYINRVLINGLVDTKEGAVLRTSDLAPGKLLRQTDIFTSEQNLYATDAFETVEIKPEPVGRTPDGMADQSDIIISVSEKPPRLITYGGGYSTDVGLSGFFDIRHFNLFGGLNQGGAQVRVSQRQQLVQFDFVNPRFIPDGTDSNGKKRYAPLTFSAQYQRDSTVTRFFRSTFDAGTFGVVQRIDENGNPIDEFGNSTGDPTINRLSLSVESNRTISRKDRSILFLKYRFEDVRLFNFESLLIKELLRPDARIRISGVTATFVRDTRRDCALKYSLLDLINRGEPGEKCRYSAGDPTDGGFLTAEYKFSTPALGANVGFNRLQLSYNRYFTVGALRNTTFAGRMILGLAKMFSGGDRFEGTQYPGLAGLLPISERFFAGGSTTLRGFEFETAGPRIVVMPEGIFRNQQGEEVMLNPFTVPFGGNALAIVNLEARVPFTEWLRVVPFYDGGNVFRTPSEIFKPTEASSDPFLTNLRAKWTNTLGLGFRIKTPVGGEFAIDYGYLLRPPEFIIPSTSGPDGIIRLPQGQFHFRFSQAF